MTRRLVIAALVVMLGGLQWRLWVSDGGLTHTHRLKVRVSVQTEENGRLRARNAALDAEVQDLKSGVAAIEARARATLGMIRPGETFYLVVDR
jgi:cell division protein FtsB